MKRPQLSLAPVKVSLKSSWSSPKARRFRALLVIFVIIVTACGLGYILLSETITGIRSEIDANQRANDLINLELEMNTLIRDYLSTHTENEERITDPEDGEYRHIVRWYPLLNEESAMIDKMKSTLNSLDMAAYNLAGPIVYLKGERKTKALAVLDSARAYQNSASLLVNYISDAGTGYLSGVEIYMKIGNGNPMISYGDSRILSASYLADSYNYYLDQCNNANRQWYA